MGKSAKRTKKPIIEDDEEVYHVEVITKARVTAASDSSSASEGEGSVSDILRKKKKRNKSEAKWQYHVKWAGYDSDANSWEPEENVADCQRLLSSFWEHIGMDNDDYPVGFVVSADENWIKREKKFFKKEYKGLQEKLKQQKNAKQLANRSKISISHSTSASSTAKGKQKADIELTSSDSDDDQPLSEVVPAKRKSNFILSDEESEKSAPPTKTQKTDSSSRRVTLQDPLPLESNTLPVESLFTPSPEGLSVPKPLPQQPKVHPIPLPRLKKPSFAFKMRRPPNQHSDIAAGTWDPASMSSNSGLSTKQRLKSLALNPVLPKNASQSPVIEVDRTRPSPSLAPTKHVIKEISFKKNPQRTPTIEGPVTPSTTSQAIAGSSIFNDSVLTPSLSRGPPSMSFHRRSSSQRENRQIEATPMEVDDFLSTVMPEALAAPLTASPQIEQGPLPPKPLINRTQLPPIKIQKKWKWSGLFMLEQPHGHTESFNVNIQDCTEPVSTGLRFSFVMNETDKLVAHSFHDIMDVGVFLRACQPAAQLGRMALQDSQDAQPTAAFSTLSLYMAKRKQVIFIPALLEQDIIGHVLLFAPEKDLIQRLNVPQELCRAQSLVVALLPWNLTATQIAMDWQKPISLALSQYTSMEPMTSDSAGWERSIRSKPLYHHALRILQFPKDLYEFMVREQGRPYIMWHDGGDNTNIRNYSGFETLCLESIMEQCRAGLAKHSTVSTRVVFIHVGALTTVYRIPQLSDRREKCPQVRFYTYGTHESVVPEIWGIHEIWPCGGVITFTPQAALDDFFGLLHRIRQAHTHPLWTCYVLPSVIGMIATLVCGNEDPIAVYDRGEFVFKELLEAIASGELAMITSPRDNQRPISASDPNQQWLDEFALSSLDTERAVLQHAIDSFKAKSSNIQASEWMRVITVEIAVDLTYMQRHPAIMKDYRRYVVLRGDQQVSLPDDGFERVTISEFDFRDEFYPKQ